MLFLLILLFQELRGLYRVDSFISLMLLDRLHPVGRRICVITGDTFDL